VVGVVVFLTCLNSHTKETDWLYSFLFSFFVVPPIVGGLSQIQPCNNDEDEVAMA